MTDTDSGTSIAWLKDKIAIVTGSSSGIGREIAIAYAQAGAFVVCSDLTPDLPARSATNTSYPGVRTHEILNSKHASQAINKPRAVFIEANVTSAASVEALMRGAVATYGRVDILVNNAGILAEARTEKVFPRIHETPESVWDADLAVNAKGVWLATKYAIAQMLAQPPHAATGDRGWIINISSITGLVGYPGTSSYTASKGAVLQMTKAVAIEYAKDRIHVNSIHPGFTDTSLLDPLKALHGADAAQDMLAKLHPWGRMGKVSDVAKVAVFLAGDGASWCTGAPFIVDGGYTAQ